MEQEIKSKILKYYRDNGKYWGKLGLEARILYNIIWILQTDCPGVLADPETGEVIDYRSYIFYNERKGICESESRILLDEWIERKKELQQLLFND